MEFGRVEASALESIDFSLAADPENNGSILNGKKNIKAYAYIGCAKWGRKEWVGKIYPPGTKPSDFLEHYAKHYNSIELNATHYKIYTEKEIEKWAEKTTNPNFKFCPKIPQLISHFSGFTGIDAVTASFLKGVSAFKENLGPIFLQVSENYDPGKKENLFKYLRSLPTDLQFFLEVRHPDWFKDQGLKKELFETMGALNIGSVITDTAGRRDCAHMELTIPKTFIRYVGNSLHPTDYTRIDNWVERIKHWLDNGLQEFYFFMHMHDEVYSPELTGYLVDKLNENCKLNLQRPVFIQQQLF